MLHLLFFAFFSIFFCTVLQIIHTPFVHHPTYPYWRPAYPYFSAQNARLHCANCLFFMIIAGLRELDALCMLEYMRQITF